MATSYVIGSVLPSGTLLSYAGDMVPKGWLECDGRAVNRTDYADLFAQIGVTYGGGGSDFNLPDFRGRAIVGEGSGYGRGSVGGSEGVTLAANNLPLHAHATGSWDVGNDSHSHSGETARSVSANHTHSFTIGQDGGNLYSLPFNLRVPNRLNDAWNAYWSAPGWEAYAWLMGETDGHVHSGNSNGNSVKHTHSFSFGNQSVGHNHALAGSTAANTPSGASFDNRQPYLVLRIIIKT